MPSHTSTVYNIVHIIIYLSIEEKSFESIWQQYIEVKDSEREGDNQDTLKGRNEQILGQELKKRLHTKYNLQQSRNSASPVAQFAEMQLCRSMVTP